MKSDLTGLLPYGGTSYIHEDMGSTWECQGMTYRFRLPLAEVELKFWDDEAELCETAHRRLAGDAGA